MNTPEKPFLHDLAPDRFIVRLPEVHADEGKFLGDQDPITSKVCTKCKRMRLLSEFSLRKRSGEEPRLHSWCRACSTEGSRNARLKLKYGMTLAEYDQMAEDQAGVCDICGDPPGAYRLAVDHCHDTGKVRALLCLSCNTALGHLKDDPALFAKAVTYLLKHKDSASTSC